jgi:hypothetical protein
MMKKLFSAIGFLTGCFAFAQTPVTITSVNMPSANDTIRYSNVRPNSIDVNLTGANYTWNYDTLSVIRQGRYDYLAAMNTPYGFYFIGTGKYGMKIADSIGAGAFTFTEVYNFYKKQTSDFHAEGIGFKYNGFPLAGYYSDDDELYTFPLNYLDYDSTTYAFSVSLGGNISYSQKGYRINYVDGWGTIKTPYDSAQCIRLVSTSYGIDSINYNGMGFSFPNWQRSYKWMVTTEKIPFLEVTGRYTNSVFTPTVAMFRDNYINLSGINEHSKENEFVVYPNPSENEFNFYSKNNAAVYVELTDINGKSVCSEKILFGKASIKTEFLMTGMYIYKVRGSNNELLETGKVILAR